MLQQILDFLPEDHPWRGEIHWFDETDSTNAQAKALTLSGAPHGTVLIADRQTAGRGRLGRSFQSPAGMGIYMSVLLRPQCPADQLMHLTCATAVAACDAIENSIQLRPGIKWTNDLVWGKKKLGGILTELISISGQTCVIIGIGLNCCQSAGDFPEDLRDMACSLAMISGRKINRAAVAAQIIMALSDMDARLLSDKTAIMDIYRRDCITVGKDICLLRGGEVLYGHAHSVCDDGALLVSFSDGHTETVNSGEVSIRGMYGYV